MGKLTDITPWVTLKQSVTLLTMFISLSLANVSLRVTAPLGEVEEDGVFSIHCEVSNLQEEQEVSILRNVNGRLERLSLNEEVVKSSLGDRVFIATRLLSDGPVVYFLSIMEATKDDEGEYVCEIRSASRDVRDLPYGSVDIHVMYFPSESSIACSQATSPVSVGDVLKLNCSSDAAYPLVDVQWKKTYETEPVLNSHVVKSHKSVFAEVDYVVTSNDNGGIFICSVTSKAFPNEERTCHVGPITVLPNPSGPLPSGPNTDKNDNKNNKHDIMIPSLNTNTDNSFESTEVELIEACQKQCSNMDGSLLLWIIATVSAAVIAVTFFVLVIVLMTKYKSLNSSNRLYESHMMYAAEKIYDEVGTKQDDRNIVYMSLDKRDALRNTDGHEYIGTNDRRF